MAKLFYRYAAMNAGKSTALLQVAHNYLERNCAIRLLTSAKDDRTKVGVIASRLGISKEAEVYSPETDLATMLDARKVDCILIDEAQFMTPEQVSALHKWVHLNNVPAICYGIRSDFQGKAFPGSAALLTLADELEEIRTICECKRRATMNMRVDADGNRVREGEQVMIGGNNQYRSVCAKCFYLAT